MNANDCIFFQIAKTYQKGMAFLIEYFKEFNITPAQGMLLSFLDDEDNITPTELSAKSLIDNASLTGLLDRLEKSDIVKRIPKKGDRRALLITLTDKGKDLASKIKQLALEANKDFLKNLSEDEQKQFRNFLKRFFS